MTNEESRSARPFSAPASGSGSHAARARLWTPHPWAAAFSILCRTLESRKEPLARLRVAWETTGMTRRGPSEKPAAEGRGL